MVYVLFEVTIKPACSNRYLDMAAALKSDLAQADGFISSERFSSLSTEGKLLSLSLWESEAAVANWRNHAGHRHSQHAGCSSMFENFRITVLSPLRSYTPTERAEAPADSKAYFEET